jgi:hypothetical protein
MFSDGWGCHSRPSLLDFFAGRTRGPGEVLRLEFLDVELRDTLAHGLQNIFSRALNKIRKPTTAGEITELLNGDLDQGDRPSKKKTPQTAAKCQ